jgi:hypothetical protein
MQRLHRLEQQLGVIVPSWSMAPPVVAFQVMRGASFLAAMTFAAEIGDVRRFDTPQQLRSFLSLVRAESSTGDTVRRKGLTVAGNRPLVFCRGLYFAWQIVLVFILVGIAFCVRHRRCRITCTEEVFKTKEELRLSVALPIWCKQHEHGPLCR